MNSLRLMILCGMLLVSSQSAFAADIFRLWHGVGIQGTESVWSTEIDLRQVAPTVRYPSLKCSGIWLPLGVQNGVYEFQEVIKVGRKACIDGYVRVYLLSRNRMVVVYYQFRGEAKIARSVVFPGPHHKDKNDHMINRTRQLIESSVK